MRSPRPSRDYHPLTGKPERSDFNRNATAHRVKEPQYRQVNSLSALMLVISLLIELDTLIAAEAERVRAEREADEVLAHGPQDEHFDRVLRHGAAFVEDGELSTAGMLYATSLTSWLPEDDPRAKEAEALRRGWENGHPVQLDDLDALRGEVETLRDETLRVDSGGRGATGGASDGV